MKDYMIPQKKQQKKTSSKEEVSYSHKGFTLRGNKLFAAVQCSCLCSCIPCDVCYAQSVAQISQTKEHSVVCDFNCCCSRNHRTVYIYNFLTICHVDDLGAVHYCSCSGCLIPQYVFGVDTQSNCYCSQRQHCVTVCIDVSGYIDCYFVFAGDQVRFANGNDYFSCEGFCIFTTSCYDVNETSFCCVASKSSLMS